MRKYVKPMMTSEMFTANEFVSACGDSGAAYYFECNSASGTVYADKDGDGILDRIGGYSPCDKKHTASTNSAFKVGFVDRNSNGTEDEGEKAIIWLEYVMYDQWVPDGDSLVDLIPGVGNGHYEEVTKLDNWHATNNLNMDSWEIAKS